MAGSWYSARGGSLSVRRGGRRWTCIGCSPITLAPLADRPLPPGRVRRGFANIRKLIGTPAHVAKPARPGPGRPKGSASGPAPRYPVPKKTGNTDKTDTPAAA